MLWTPLYHPINQPVCWKNLPLRAALSKSIYLYLSHFRCLFSAGDESLGTIDFYQMHTYVYQGTYSSTSPMNKTNSAYGLTKPNVIGEYSRSGGDGRDITLLHKWAYENGYRFVLYDFHTWQ